MIGRAIAAGVRAFLLAMRCSRSARRPRTSAGTSCSSCSRRRSTPACETSALKWTIVVAGLVVLFLAQSILQTRPNGWFSNWLQPHLVSGLYIDDWFTRVTFRLWPPGFR